MNVISVVSAKGGVGKSTLSANLSVALNLLGLPVLIIDFDSQNALRFHFSFNRLKTRGIAHTVNNNENWCDLTEMTKVGVAFLSYGVCDEEQHQSFEEHLRDNPFWLKEKLKDMELSKDTVVIVDTPPGTSVHLRQVLRASDFVVAVTLPDAGSYTTLPQLKELIEKYCFSQEKTVGYGVVINQIDVTRQLAKDMRRVILSMFNDVLIGEINLDQSISEALAYGQTIYQYNPHSEAAEDIMLCAKWIKEYLEKNE